MAKTNTVVVFNPWEIITAGTMSAGALAVDIEDSFISTLQFEVAPLTALAFTGETEITVEYSGDETNWTEAISLSVLLDNDNAGTTLDGAFLVGEEEILLADASSVNTIGGLLFIQENDPSIVASETVRVKSVSSDTITLANEDGLIYYHGDDRPVYSNVQQWTMDVPASVKHVRVLCNNTDDTYSVAFTARILKTTSLT